MMKPVISRWRRGFRLIRPIRLPVSSPSQYALRAWLLSWTEIASMAATANISHSMILDRSTPENHSLNALMPDLTSCWIDCSLY